MYSIQRYPVGHFVRALGPLGDKETENEVLLLEHDVPHSKFSEEVLSFLPKLPWSITEEVSLSHFHVSFGLCSGSSFLLFILFHPMETLHTERMHCGAHRIDAIVQLSKKLGFFTILVFRDDRKVRQSD